ncbi:hypothetical protein JCM1841_006006 [Sporobolomyces salmonicolor]
MSSISTTRRTLPLPPPPPFPDPQSALQLSPSDLPEYLASLAAPSSYSLSTPSTRARLNLALYSFALNHSSPIHRLFLPHDDSQGQAALAASISDDWSLSSAQAPSSSSAGDEYSPSRRGKVCGHVFKSGESVYRCRDCGVDATCVLCAKCFHASGHSRLGHDVTMHIHSGVGAGCCDCGDHEAWKEGRQRDCRFHGVEGGELGGQQDQGKSKGKAKAREDDELVEVAKVRVRETLESVVDWMLDVWERSPDELVPPRTIEDIIGPSSPSTAPTSTSPPPLPPSEPVQIGANDLFSGASPPPPSSSIEAPPARRLHHASPLSPTVPSTLAALFPNPSTTSTFHPSSPAQGAANSPYAVVLWNDEKHSFSQVIDIVSRAVGCSRRAASDVAQRVDTHGRDVVLVTPDAGEAFRVAKTIGAIELAVSVRGARETFCESVAGAGVRWLLDLTKARLAGEGGAMGEIVAHVMLERKEGGKSRFMRMAEIEQRLWKEARRAIQELCVALMSVGLEVKTELSIQYAAVYPTVAASYLLTDREPENSLIFFGVQVFTVPSVCVALISHHRFLSSLLSILFAFFTEQVDLPRPSPGSPSSARSKPKRLVLPPNPTVRSIDPNSPSFTRKRYFQVFSDLNHLVSSPAVQRLLCSPAHSALLDELTAFLSLFTGMNPNLRAVGTHVEYESDAWVAAFNVTIQLARLCRSFGEAYRYASALDLAKGLSLVLSRMTDSSSGSSTPTPPALHQLTLGGKSYPSVRFDVASEKVSFHHPLPWLFAEMFKNVEKLDRGELEPLGVKGVGELAGRGSPVHFLAAMDQPLRVIVLVAQIRAGLWVRNGFGVRAQQLHYKEYSLRENTYDQDVFFLQAALVILDPSTVFASILDRFALRSWLALGDDQHPAYDSAQAMALTEEMLTLLITLVSDPTYAQPLSEEAALRRELVHHLALGSCVYSDLMRRVSERFADDPAMDRVLANVAHFKPPSGTNDQGTYSLRDELYDEVDPYFARYTRNQREEVDKIVREHLKKRSSGGDNDEPVIVPAKLDVRVGPFVDLSRALASDVLHRLVYYSLKHGRARGELFSEVVVDQALHLAMLALIEQPDAFVRFASGPAPFEETEADSFVPVLEDESTLVKLLVKLEEDDRMQTVKPKTKWVLDRLAEHLGEAVTGLRRREEEDEVSPEQKAMEAKRLAAKARQAAIMQQFAQAQSAFLESVEDEDDEELDDGDAMDSDTGAAPPPPKVNFGSCIVCQDELEDSKAFGLLGLMQGSSLIRLTPTGEDDLDFQKEILDSPSSLDRDASSLRPFGIASHKVPVHAYDETGDGLASGFPQNQKSGIYASSCGHLMHLACFETYCASLAQRHRQQPTRCHPETIERREFVCPLCKSLGNVLLPAATDSPAFMPYAGPIDERNLLEWSRPTADPLIVVVDEGQPDVAAESDVDEAVLLRVDRLQLLSDIDHSSSFKPWRVSLALPTLLPGHFSEREGVMVARLLQVVTALKGEIGGPGGAVTTLPKDVLAYTVASLEIASRGTPDPAWKIPDASLRLLQSMLSTMQDLVELMTQLEDSPRIAAIAVRQRLGGLFARDSKFWDVEFTLFDPLASLIEAAACMPSAFYHVAAVGFYTALAQSFVGVFRLFHQSASLAEWSGKYPSAEAQEYLDLQAIKDFFPSPALFNPGSLAFSLTLGKHLHAQVLPFLRRAAIVARVTFGEPSPSSHDDDPSEFRRLLALLRVPPPSEVLSPGEPSSDPTLAALQLHLQACASSASAFLSGPDLATAVDRLINSSAPEIEHPVPYELLGLPHQLDTLIAASAQRECRRCEKLPENPALCLLCGAIVCCQSFCCMAGEDEAQHGECNEHMWTCGGSVGIYLLVKRNSILYLHTDKGAFATPPYLDSHGEVDVGGRRNRSQFPQYLHRGRYDEVRRTWLQHGVPTLVARKLDAATDHGGWTTM